jgi:phage terminase small subunit
MGPLANQRHERFAQALAQGKSASEAYVLVGYKANDGNASRMKGNERILARVQEIVGRAAERAEVSVERVLPRRSRRSPGARPAGSASKCTTRLPPW